jgi:hypothetical protein
MRRSSVLSLCLAVALLLPASASTQSPVLYTARLNKTFTTSGNVKQESCGGNCYEGHDCTTCVGVRVFREGVSYSTTVYDKTQCCQFGFCGTDQKTGIPCGGNTCPANGCPSNQGPFHATISPVLATCVYPGTSFYVPSFTARLGNLTNNQPLCGSHCSGGDFFQPYGPFNHIDDSFNGGFWTSCPNPSNPAISCQVIPDPSATCHIPPPPPTTTPAPSPTPPPPSPPPSGCGSHNNVCFGSYNACARECCGVCERRINCGGGSAHKCFE